MEQEVKNSEEKPILVESQKVEENIDQDLEEMGSCFGNFSSKAEECKVCKVNENCSQETRGIKK